MTSMAEVLTILSKSPCQPGRFRVTTALVTPAMAETFLANQAPQRRLDMNRVKVNAGVMGRHEWLITNQGLAFDFAGRLIDGQHRLHAVIKSGVAVPFLVVFMDHETMRVIDAGKKRTTADLLTITHPEIKSAVVVAAIANAHLQIRAALARNIQLGNSYDAPNWRQLAEYEEHQTAIRGIMEYHTPIKTAPLLGASMVAMPVDPVKITAFLESVKSGAGLAEGSPALLARNYILSREHSSPAERGHALRVWFNLLHNHLAGKSGLKINGGAEHGQKFFAAAREKLGLDADVRQAA